MPQHKSCKKRLKQAAKSRIRNAGVKTVLKKTIKEARATLAEGQELDLNKTYSTIDRVSSKGVIHKKKAARLKSRMAKAVARNSEKN